MRLHEAGVCAGVQQAAHNEALWIRLLVRSETKGGARTGGDSVGEEGHDVKDEGGSAV